MADQDVGGISVRFTAEAAQLQREIQKLEQRLRQFDTAHGQKRIRLQADLVMPGNRVMADFRRGIEQQFGAQGNAGQIKARIQLIPPTSAEIKALSGKIGTVPVKVVGDFAWRKAPPKTVEITVVEKTAAGQRKSPTEQAAEKTTTAAATTRQTKAAAIPTGRARATAQTRRASKREVYAENNGWSNQILIEDFLNPGTSTTARRDMRDELVRRGYDRSALDSQLRRASGGGRAGGARGLTGGMTGAFGRGVAPVQHWSSRGLRPPEFASIQAMVKRGEYAPPIADLYDPYSKGSKAKAPSLNMGQIQSLSERDMARRLRTVVRRASPDDWREGVGWYKRAGELTQQMGAGTGLGRHQIAGATAMFSQQAGWAENVRNVQDFFEALRRGAKTAAEVEREVVSIRRAAGLTTASGKPMGGLGLPDRVEDALKAAFAQTPRGVDEVFRGSTGQGNPKRHAFYRALMGDPSAFTVDRHQAIMMSGATIGPSTQRAHDPFQKVGRQVASEFGISPADLQALSWVAGLGSRFAGADPYQMQRAGMGGGARGFAAKPAWLKTQPSGGAGMIDTVADVARRGRPGVHIEPPADQLAARGYGSMYSVARNEQGTALGALAMFLRGGHDVSDVMPYVDPAARGQGIGKSLYAHAMRAGFDVETPSDLNAGRPGAQTNLGQALWMSRKRAMGVDPEEAKRTAEARFFANRARREPDENPTINPAFDEFAEQRSRENDLQRAMAHQRAGGARGFAGPLKLTTGRNRDTTGRRVHGSDTMGVFAGATHKGGYQTGRVGYDTLMQQGIDPMRLFNDMDVQYASVIRAVRADPALSEMERRELLHRGELPRGVNPSYDEAARMQAGQSREQWMETDPFPSRGLTWPASARLGGGARGAYDPYRENQRREGQQRGRDLQRARLGRDFEAGRPEDRRPGPAPQTEAEVAARNAGLYAALGRTPPTAPPAAGAPPRPPSPPLPGGPPGDDEFSADPGMATFMQREAERGQRRRRRNDELRARTVPEAPVPVASTKGRVAARIFPETPRVTGAGFPIDLSQWPIVNPGPAGRVPGAPGIMAGEAGHGPQAGIVTGATTADVLRGRALEPRFEEIHGAQGHTALGAGIASTPQALAEFGVPRVRDVQTGSNLAATPAQLQQAATFQLARPSTAGTGLDVPTFQRKQQGEAIGNAAGETIAQHLQRLQAADPGRVEEGLAALDPEDRAAVEELLAKSPLFSGGGAGRTPPPPTAGGAAGGPPGEPPRGPFTPEDAAGTSLSARNRLLVAQARGAQQVRAVGTTAASLIANLFGGRAGREVAIAELSKLGTEIEHVEKRADRAYKTMLTGQIEYNRLLDDKAPQEALDAQLSAVEKASEEWAGFQAQLGPLAQKQAQLAGGTGRLTGAVVGMGSSIAGTMAGLALYSGAVAAVTGAIAGFGRLAGPSIEAATGYSSILHETAKSLGEVARAEHGYVDRAVSLAAVQTGLGSATLSTIRPYLEQAAAIEAGNSAFSDQITLIKAATGIQFAQQPFRTKGAIPGITGSFGGFLGTPIGATTPLFEQLAQTAPGGTAGERFAVRGLTTAGGVAGGALAGGIAGAAFGGVGAIPGALIGGAIGGLVGATGGGDVAEGLTGLKDLELERIEDVQGAQSKLWDSQSNTFNAAGLRLTNLGRTLGTLSEAAVRADESLGKQVEATLLVRNAADFGPEAQRAIEATAEALRDMGTPEDQVQALRNARFAAVRPGTFQPVDQKTLERWSQTALRGLSMPAREEAARLQGLQVSAQLQLSQWQGQMQRQTLIPGGAFLSQLGQGRIDPETQRFNAGNIRGGTRTLPPELLRGQFGAPGGPGSFNANIDTSQLTAGLSELGDLANSGRDALAGMVAEADNINMKAGISSNLLGSFNELTEAAARTAGTIRGISQASAWMQVNLQVKQINEQIFVMNRSLQDAKSFLSGVGEGELGVLQFRARGLEIAQAELGFRQQELALANQQLGIQATSLQLSQRQRQINFQRAIAGFVAPGQTPEEIAARQKEAGLEADFAQQGQDIAVTQLDNQREAVALAREQLGISKEQFAVQQAMVTVSAERAIGDLARGIGLLQEQARVTVQLQVNSDAIDAYQEVLNAQTEQLRTVIEEAYGVQQTVMSNAAALAAQYGGTITTWNNLILQGLNNYLVGARQLLSGRVGGGTPGGIPQNNPNSMTPTANAPGFFGSVSGATQMIVGEAGPETVAILRNPRSMTVGGGGGGGGSPTMINITVTGNNVGSQQDADMLAETIARKVEETMSRRTSLLGLRPN